MESAIHPAQLHVTMVYIATTFFNVSIYIKTVLFLYIYVFYFRWLFAP